jgi:hypothetical protein
MNVGHGLGLSTRNSRELKRRELGHAMMASSQPSKQDKTSPPKHRRRNIMTFWDKTSPAETSPQ